MNIQVEIPVIVRANVCVDGPLTDETLEQWIADYASVVANAVANNVGARLKNAGHVEYVDDNTAAFLDDDIEAEYHGEDIRILGT